MPISIETLISQMEWAEAKRLRELSLTIDGYELTLSRAGGNLPPEPKAVAPMPVETGAEDLNDEDLHAIVTAPVAGLCLLSPESGGAPFVSVGDRVETGQTLCMIEAMKVMIPLIAPHGGQVEEIFVTDNTAILADAQIMRIS